VAEISEALRELVASRANGCCEYCKSQEAYSTERFSVDHIQPRIAGGPTTAENLALACQGCNSHKATRTVAVDPATNTPTPLFHPRQQDWRKHFAWNEDHLRLVGLTPTGRATISLLHLNRASLLRLRGALIIIKAHPPAEA